MTREEHKNTAALVLDLAADIVAAYVRHHSVPRSELQRLIGSVLGSLEQLAGLPAAPTPAVAVSRSITVDYIVCLDDGKKFKSLRKHLTTLGMTPDQYRQKWKLPADYPMVAPGYSATRSALAKELGLGRWRGDVGRKARTAKAE